MPRVKICENCEEAVARYWRSTTDADGVILERVALCLDCAGRIRSSVRVLLGALVAAWLAVGGAAWSMKLETFQLIWWGVFGGILLVCWALLLRSDLQLDAAERKLDEQRAEERRGMEREREERENAREKRENTREERDDMRQGIFK